MSTAAGCICIESVVTIMLFHELDMSACPLYAGKAHVANANSFGGLRSTNKAMAPNRHLTRRRRRVRCVLGL
jgi:hypothetical protein